jgi:ATP-dependent helicase/nuclease subunit A
LAAGGRRKLLDRLGPEAEDPIDEFLSLALAFERTNVVSMQGFLYWLKAGKAEVVRDLEQGFDRVRVLTVHGSKGLQAPIVILPDTMQMPTDGPRLLWPDNDDVVLWPPAKQYRDERSAQAYAAARAAQADEYRRLLYVAMTRAEDRLYVCGWQMRNKAPSGCWYNLVDAALRGVAREVPEPALRLADDEPVPQVFRIEQGQTDAVRPYEPVREMDFGAIPGWASEPAPPESIPPRPLTPSNMEAGAPAVRSPAETSGAAPAVRGRLIHRLLQILPAIAPDRRRRVADQMIARVRPAPDAAEATRLAGQVLAILDDPQFAALFGPNSLAEVPVSGMVTGADGEPVVVSGQVDRLAVTDGVVLVVDYKSNRRPPRQVETTPAVYLRQMAAYRALLTQIYPTHTVSCALLWTEGPALAVLPSALLDRHQPISLAGESAGHLA